MAIEYEDFAVAFTAGEQGSYRTRVDSPAGEGRATFRLEAESRYSLHEITAWWSCCLRKRNFGSEDEPSDVTPRLTPREIGALLFRMVFRDHLHSLLDQSLGLMLAQGRGLRLVLRFDLDEGSTERMARLPWELMFREDSNKFLALSPTTAVVRYLNVDQPTVLPPLRDAPRVLVAIGGASDLPPLDEGKERAKIIQALEGSGVEPFFLNPTTAEALFPALKRTKSHFLHFVGHGGFVETTGEGALYLKGEDGKQAQPLSGSQLATILERVPNLRFVFLNACETARTGGEDGRNPFAGVAGALVNKGVPSVIAMQAPIGDNAAITFSQKCMKAWRREIHSKRP